MTATKIEVIYDRDHGLDNYGWYVRFRAADGEEIDSPAFIQARCDAGQRRLRKMVREQAKWENVTLSRPLEFEIHD